MVMQEVSVFSSTDRRQHSELHQGGWDTASAPRQGKTAARDQRGKQQREIVLKRRKTRLSSLTDHVMLPAFGQRGVLEMHQISGSCVGLGQQHLRKRYSLGTAQQLISPHCQELHSLSVQCPRVSPAALAFVMACGTGFCQLFCEFGWVPSWSFLYKSINCYIFCTFHKLPVFQNYFYSVGLFLFTFQITKFLRHMWFPVVKFHIAAVMHVGVFSCCR